MEINGIEYKKREVKQTSYRMKKIIETAMLFSGLNTGKSRIKGVNIVEEFRLIQDKK